MTHSHRSMLSAGGNDSCVTRAELEALKTDLNQFFLIAMGMIVWFMAPGFALLEAGMVQARNTANVFARNLADQLVGIIMFWLIGYGLAFGNGNAFCGTSNFGLIDADHPTYAFWFLQYTYAATPASIVQGAVTERLSYVASIVQTFFLLGFTYPIVVHWAWASQGWLQAGFPLHDNSKISFQDYAGSGVVHATGGAAALIAAIIVGARSERKTEGTRRLKAAPPAHNLSLMALGALILHFGFLAFNAASHYKISGQSDGDYISHAIVNTVIAFSASSLAGLLCRKLINHEKWAFSPTVNASLTGMVSICASCNQVDTWSAFVIGFIAGLAYVGAAALIPRVGIDDPLEAISVHYVGGSWGILAAGLFAKSSGLLVNWTYFSLINFLWQIVGWLALSLWTFAMTGIVFGVMRCTGILRVSTDAETDGIDSLLHGESAYPSEAYLSNTNSMDATLDYAIRQRQGYQPINPTDSQDGVAYGSLH